VTGKEVLGHFADKDGWKKIIDDVFLINEFIRRTHPGTPVILMGHSMGSFVVQSYAIRHGDTIDALVLSGSAFHTAFSLSYGELVMRMEAARSGQRGRSKLINLLTFVTYNKTFTPVRTQADWLSRDSRQVDRYLEDTLCGFLCTNRLWLDMMHGLKEIIQPRNLRKIPNRVPVLLFSGEMDPMSYDPHEHGIKKLAARLKAAGQHTVNYKIFPKGRHEILNETNRNDVLTFWSNWLEHHAPLKRTKPAVAKAQQRDLDLSAA
jgi:alpha-beta hydrolase superfamily lysophospholipase